MQTSVAKKIFAVGVAASTVLMSLAPFAAQAAAHAEGTNIKSSDGTVWMVTGGQRRAYTSAGAFLSYGFNSWSSVVDANADDLALPTGGFIPPQDGKIICSDRGADKGTCYLVTGGQKAGFTSAAVFTGLGFSFARSQKGDVSWMTSTTNIDNTTAAHRPGVLVNNAGTVQLVGATGLLGIPDVATFNGWGYSFSDVVPANAADKAMSQTGVMAARTAGQLSPTATTGGSTGGSVVSGSVSAMLATDSPASNTVINNQAVADLAHFAFSGTGTVTQVVLKRIGVSADTTLNNVYLYVGNNKITDAASVSSGVITFSNPAGIFTVSGPTVVSVKADISSSATAGQTVGVQLTGYTVASGSPASVAISGSLMTVAVVSDLATLTLTAAPTPSATGNITAGTMNASLWSGNFNVGTRKVNLKYIAFKQVGSIPAGSLQNMKLYVAGSPVGAPVASLDSSNNVVFDMTGAPVTLNTGSQTFELRGDVVKGSSFNYTFRVQTASDIVAVDTSYGVNITLALSGGAVMPATTAAQTVSQGSTSTQQDASFVQTQVVKNSSNVTLGQWTMKAYGEDVKVQTMNVIVNYFDSAGNATTTTATEGFNNLGVYVNGGMVGSSQTTVALAGTTHTRTYGTTNLFTIPAGTTVTVAVKGDMALDSTTKVASVRADIVTPINSMQGVTSYQTFPTVAATFQGVSQTVVTSSITLAKNGSLANGTLSTNLVKQKIGSYTVQASSADGVRVSSLTVTLAGTINPTTTLANLYLVTPDYPTGTTPVNPQASNNFSVNFSVAANAAATVDVYADISNATGNVTTTLQGTGTGTISGQTVYLNSTGLSGGSAVTGQTMTAGTGTLTNPPVLNTGSSPVAAYVVGSPTSTNQPMATFTFVSASGVSTINELRFTVTGTNVPTDTPITKVYVGGQSGTVLNNGTSATVSVTGLNISVPNSTAGLNVPVTVDFAPVSSTGGVASGKTAVLNLTYVKYTSGGVTTILNPVSGNTVPSPTMTLVASKPTVTASAPTSKLVGNQSVEAIDVTVTADNNGDITINALPITVGLTAATVSTTSTSSVAVYRSTDLVTNVLSSMGSAFGATTGGTVTLNLNTAYTRITAGQSMTFKVFVTNNGVTGTGVNGASMATGLSATNFAWTDTAGGGASPLTGGSLIPGFPSTFLATVYN